MRLSLILPVHNQEAAIAGNNFDRIFEYIRSMRLDCEVIVVENGSTDDSVKMLRALRKRYRFRLIISKRSGRGLALRLGVASAHGDIIGYMDTDLAVPPKYLARMMREFERGYDLVIGNRYVKGAKSKRNVLRYIESKIYICAIRALYSSRITDFQCGFKFFRSDLIRRSIGKVNDDRWFFDTEILILAERSGARICQMPVSFFDTKGSTVKLSDSIYFIGQIIKNRNF